MVKNFANSRQRSIYYRCLSINENYIGIIKYYYSIYDNNLTINDDVFFQISSMFGRTMLISNKEVANIKNLELETTKYGYYHLLCKDSLLGRVQIRNKKKTIDLNGCLIISNKESSHKKLFDLIKEALHD